MMKHRMIWIVLAALIPVTAASGQGGTAAAAADAWNARDWARAAQAYDALAKADTSLAQPYLRLAVALTALGRYDDARKNLAIAQRRGAPASQVAFRTALIEAGAGRIDSAFSHLKRATSAGLFSVPVPGDSLAQMGRLKADTRYAAFVTDMDRNARPCLYDAKYNEFDFWVGTWDVRPRGSPSNPPAKNVVTKIDDGCVVYESWTAPASVGQSFNIWDRTRQKWFQYWVDNSGGLHEYSGTYSDNAMKYEGDTPATPPATGRVKTRLTFFKIAADTVRQFAETQNADGTWATAYDLMYIRAKAQR